MSKEEKRKATIQMLKIYAETDKPVTQHFYQGLCIKAIELLESEPEPGEFTKDIRQRMNFVEGDLMPSEICLKEACDIIDRLWRMINIPDLMKDGFLAVGQELIKRDEDIDRLSADLKTKVARIKRLESLYHYAGRAIGESEIESLICAYDGDISEQDAILLLSEQALKGE